jgi:ketosteroid isomerase-like protein
MGAAVNIPSAAPDRSTLSSRSRRTAVALLFFSTLMAPIFLAFARAIPQGSTVATLAEIREAWVRDLHAKELEPVLKFYATDAAFLQPNGERVTGTAALRSLFQNIMATFDSDLTLHSRNLEASGDLAYDSGDFEETLTNRASGAKIASKGSYIIIYKRRAGGSWQIVQHAWTGIPPTGT